MTKAMSKEKQLRLNRKLLRELELSFAEGTPTPKLMTELKKLAEHVYEQLEFPMPKRKEQVAAALVELTKLWGKFRLDKSDNPYVFFYIVAYSGILRAYWDVKYPRV